VTSVVCSVDLLATAAEAERLWCEVDRWSSFVEGFGSLVSSEGRWPDPGSIVIWDSTPHGRGRVRERVIEHQTGLVLASEISEQRLSGTRWVRFSDLTDEECPGVRIEVQLDYRLSGSRWLRLPVDWLFVRPALRASIARELEEVAAQFSPR
jgi:hypothetical protein